MDHVLDHAQERRASRPPPLLRAGFHPGSDHPDGAVVVRLQGELDMATAPQLRRVLDAALDARPAELAVDLQDLTFADSTGIRVLLEASRRAQDAGCSLVLRSPRRSVRKALRLTGMDQLVDVELQPPPA